MKNYIVLVLIGLIVSICAKAAELHLRANTSHIPETGTPAKKYYDKAVGGDAAAQHNLAFCYATGEGGVVQDYAESVKWERMAAEQGNVSAQYALAYRYYSGEGVAQRATRRPSDGMRLLPDRVWLTPNTNWDYVMNTAMASRKTRMRPCVGTRRRQTVGIPRLCAV